MAYVGLGKNEYGTEVSKHKCDACGTEYTLCPAVKPDSVLSKNCEADECPSYDPENDAEIMFMTDAEIAEKKPIVSIEMLRKRKEGSLIREKVSDNDET